MNRSFLIILLMAIACSFLTAAVFDSYIFSSANGTYTPITGTTVSSIQTDDALSEEIPIGFTFAYGMEFYTSVKISSNGWVGLGSGANNSNLGNDLDALSTYSLLAPLWDDLSLGNGSCQYLLSGTAPNRIFTIQYANTSWNYSAGNQFNFQVKMYETGKVEFVYGSAVGTPSSASASIGIIMLPGGVNNFYSITPGTPALSSYTTENSNISQFPGDGVIYAFDPVAPVPNDLAAMTLSGNLTPSQGSASNYVITIRNMGTSPQSNYQVQLRSGTTVLASQAGTLIAPSSNASFTIPWTPAATGSISIYGKVVLAGDAYPQNDNTAPLNLVVQPAGTIAVTVGTGGELAFKPINMYYRNSLFETIYQAGEIPASGMITGLAFYNSFETNLLQKPTKIWMGLTTQSDLTTGWIPASQLIQVFDGLVDYPNGQNMINIPLQTPIAYGGGNLVMLVDRPMDTQYFSFNDMFDCQTVGDNRSLDIYSDMTNFDPTAPPAGQGNLSGQFPKTTFMFTPSSPNPTFGVAPASKNFGTVLLNSTVTQMFSVYNSGGGSLTINSIIVSGSPYFTLQNLPTLPVALTTGQVISFRAVYHPTAAGNHTATITLTDNLARTQHSVILSGNCLDPTIYTSPYVQNFDAVTVPALPIDWNKYINPVGQGESVITTNSFSSSAPNCVLMNNGWTQDGTQILIAPPIAQSMNINAMRIKFKARGDNLPTVKVGIMADITDGATFTEISTVNLTGNWAEYVVAFSSYTGTGRYIAIKHGNASWSQQLLIDDVTIENTPNNDLAALSVTGNTTPSAANPYTYTVTIYNWGINSQSNYQVKLFKQGDIEVASVAGPTIGPDTQATATLTWTPATAGATYIYGKVVLNGDQNPLNDQSPNLAILVQAEGTTAITIGTGNTTGNIPVNMYWRNSLFETIYQAEDIPAGGFITGISFYNNFITNLPQKPTKIWLGSTTQSDLSTGWIPSTALTQVFDGLVDYPSGANTITIPLSTPFPYGGTNLVMMVNRPMDTTYFNWSDVFQCQVSNLMCSLEIHADDENFDPAAPPANPDLSGLYPKTTLYFVPAGTTPMFGVVPLAKNFGNVLLNHTVSQTFTVFNSGGAPYTVNSVAFSGSSMYALSNLPALPVSLNPGQNFTFRITYHPTAAGTHNGTVTIADNLTRSRTQHNVAISGICVDPTIYTSPYFQNFNNVTPPALPIDWQTLNNTPNQTAIIQSNSNLAYSVPNSVYLNNSNNTTGDLYLIAPPLANNLVLPSMRVKLWARADFQASISVGVMSDESSSSTFTSLATLTANENWQEYVISLNAYTGAGRLIAIKHDMTSTYQGIYIDDITIETTPNNDLAALAITGNTTPSVGMASNYTVTVFNWGLNTQSAYTVKLYNASNLELASAAGQTVAANASVPVIIPWVPATQGTTTIYAKVILASDQNNLNDQSPNFTVSVQAAGTIVITVGDGTETDRIPVDMYFHNSLFETMYYQNEIGIPGLITGISFYNNFITDLPDKPTNIWLGITNQADLSAGWIPSTDLTQVFAGNVDYNSGENTISITLDNPFLYVSGNLVMMVERPMDNTFFSWSDVFYTQTQGTSRSRNSYSDTDDYDPASPPEDNVELSGSFPKTSFFFIGGLSSLQGYVRGPGNIPLEGAVVQILNSSQGVTDAQGHYSIPNIMDGTLSVTASHFGYISQTVTVVVPEDTTVVQNFTLQPMPTVTLTGRVVGSDAPTTGIPGAVVNFTGYQNYSGTANGQGYFTINGVYANQTYNYTMSALGYQAGEGSVMVGATNHNMGTITLTEIAYTPANVQATVNNGALTVHWSAPNPNSVDMNESFEGDTFPPNNWTRIVTNNGAANTQGVYPTWCRFGTVTSGTESVAPADGTWQAGFWWNYNHQDEWLISPPFNCPQGAMLIFDTYAYYGSLNGDHYYVKITNNNGVTWNVLWDASTLTGGWNAYQTPVQIDLSSYAGQQVKVAWHADDPNATSDGMWYNWFIDDVQVNNTDTAMRLPLNNMNLKSASVDKTDLKPMEPGPAMSRSADGRSSLSNRIRSPRESNLPPRFSDRSLLGYKVWRLPQGQEQNEAAWTSLTPSYITALSLIDNSYSTLPAGTYKWAVKAVYSNSVLSLAAFSNAVQVGVPTGTLTGIVRNQQNQPIVGATITAGAYQGTSNAAGSYTIALPAGLYTVTCVATGYQTMTSQNITVAVGQTTTCNFLNIPVPNEDIVQIDRTALLGNYPNPFNPMTTIRFDVKGIQPVRIDIYNIKGQLIRTLVNATKAGGHYTAVWDGRDNSGKTVASGIYQYRMQAGSYVSNKRMMLLK